MKTTVLVLSLLLSSLTTITGGDVSSSSSITTTTTLGGNHHGIIEREKQRQRFLQQYPQYINSPIITYAGFVVSLEYTLRDNVREGLMDIELYQDASCTNLINKQTNDYLNYELIPDLTPRGDGDGTRLMTIAVTINPDNVITSPIATDTSTANVKDVTWCVRTRIAEPTSPTIFAVEDTTPISVTLNLNAGITEIRNDGGSGSNGNNDLYQIETYECNESGNEISSMENAPAYTQGSTVKVCFRPNTAASNDGILIDNIAWFQWIRGEIIQNVLIDDGRMSAPALTTYECESNTRCSLSTQLSNNFFYSAGTVLGRGEAIIQRGRRFLRQPITFIKKSGEGGDVSQEQQRQMQALNSERPLEITIRIDHSDQIFGAEAYECDGNNARVEGGRTKKVGDSIRICVRPNAAAQEGDVYLRQIASFSFRQLKSGVAQFAVEPGGNQAPDGKTLLSCSPGSAMCAFQTELKEKFFNSNEKLLGRGQVLLQFGTDTDFPTRRLQMSDADFAGAAEISFDVNIQRRPQSEIDGDERWDDEAESWWKSQPKILRFVYIMIPLFLLTFLLCCCAIFFCGICPGWFPATEKSQKEVHHEEVVNIEYVREGPGPHGSEREASNNHWDESGSSGDDDPSMQEQAPPSPVPSSPRKSSRLVSAPESMKQIEAAPTTPRGRKSAVGGEASRPASSRSPRPGAGTRTESSRSMAAESVSKHSPRPGRKSSKVEMSSPKRSPRPGRKSSVGGGSSTASPRPGRRSLASDSGGTRTPKSTRRNTVSVPNSAPARSRNSAIKSPASGRRTSANPNYSAGGKRRTTGGLNQSSIPEVPF